MWPFKRQPKPERQPLDEAEQWARAFLADHLVSVGPWWKKDADLIASGEWDGPPVVRPWLNCLIIGYRAGRRYAPTPPEQPPQAHEGE